MTKPRYRPGRGALNIIVGLFVASAVIRIGGAATAVVAENTVEPVAAQDMAPEPPEAAPQDTGTLLAAFRLREQRLVERERQIANRQQALEIAETEIEQKLQELIVAEEALRETLALADSAAESDLERLATVYENMKPKDAAALFTEMTPEFAAGFLGLMQAPAAAAIMTELEAPVAYSISVMLAGRNALVPTQ